LLLCHFSTAAKKRYCSKNARRADNQFNQHFVKTGIISKDFGRLYTNLMDWRQKGDYGDMFDFNGEVVKPIIEPVEHFLDEIAQLVK